MVNTLRLFVAINFNRGTKEKLVALQDTLRARSKRGNFTLTENLHLTLAFIGECNQKQTADAQAAVASMRFEPFDVRIESIGRFKHDRGDIWWADVNADKPLLDLQHKLARRLANAGFEPEKRKYKPHITLARQVVTDASSWQIAHFSETASQIHLVKSERIDGKSVYTPVYSTNI